jgi:hypothetical protein
MDAYDKLLAWFETQPAWKLEALCLNESDLCLQSIFRRKMNERVVHDSVKGVQSLAT